MVLYANTFQHGFVLDDDVVYLQNQYVQEGVTSIDDILSHGFLHGFNQRNDQSYRPLVLINFALEHSLFGNDPTAHHIINVLLYAILVCVLFLFLRQLFPEYNSYLAFWVALLYLVHPVHTEVVANIKGRDEILHGIFALLSLISFFKYLDLDKKKFLFRALAFFLLALLSKEMAVTLLAVIPLSLYFFRKIELKQLIFKTLPLIGVLVIYFIVRSAVLDNVTFDEEMTVMNNSLAAANNLSQRIATNFLIFGKYISLLFFPHPLAWDYSFPFFPIVNFSYPLVIFIIAASVTALVLSIYGMKNKNPFAWAFLFFISTFSIVSNFFILIGATLGERFLFFPSIAFCFAVVYGLHLLSKQFQKKRSKYFIPIGIIIPILLLLSFKTYDRNLDWENNEKLFLSGAEATPNNSRAISALASMHRTRAEKAQNPNTQLKEYQLAKGFYLQSIKLYQENTDALYNLGVVYSALNNRDKARLAYQRVLEIEPAHLRAINNLGVIFLQQSDFKRAEQLFQKAISINPSFQNAYANLGAVKHNLGEKAAAQQYYEKALQLNPNDLNTQRNLNNLLN